jgi:AcrR family transcriptional regulator
VTRGAVYHHFKNKQGLFLAVLDNVQQDVAMHIEQEAVKSDDVWEQLILGCVGFVKGTNTEGCRRILLLDAPAVVGWEAWRKTDQENSMSVLQAHIDELNEQGYLEYGVDTKFMTYSISGALNELALQYSSTEDNQALYITISRMVDGFRKKKFN